VAVVDACLARIAALNARLNAFITVDAEGARAAATIAESEINAGRWRGPLHGVPAAVKDFYDTAGLRTTAAFERFANRIPARDADVVTRLKNAGAIVIGKTNMDTLGMATTGLVSFYGPVKNPWNAEYITGGSSSGSAAAVASGMCYATVDTDAIGSCRLPASCCGVVGFKGTYGLISTEGILAGEPPPDEMIRWFSHSGVTTRRVVDVALVVDALKQRHGMSQPESFAGQLDVPRRLRVGVATNFTADSDVAAAFTKAVDAVAGLGYDVNEVMVPFAGSSTGIRHIERDREAISRQLFGAIDVLLLPTTTTAVLRTNAASNPQALSPENTVFANYYGLPALSVPSGFDANGLPTGLQIVARPTADLDALTLGQQYEAAAGWFSTHPSL
jgi:aspartyl-tRNA(Asn)/glutamyl-tRNA(Gln) amidotransferase subunit A